MTSPISWMRSFSIRLRMQGAIVMVMGLFALVGVAGLLGGRHLAELNSGFMHHSLKEVHDAGNVRSALGAVRRHEKDMVIHYEDSAAVTQLRQSWITEVKAARSGLEALLQGAEDEDNTLARAVIKDLDAYVAASTPVLDQVQKGNYDTALAADKMLARAKAHVAAVENGVDAIDKIIDAEASDTRQAFDTSMQRTLWAYLGVLALATVLVVPLTMLNSASIIGPINQAHDVALAIAEGNLAASVCTDGQDETAELLGALKKMQAALHGIVGQVRESAESIQTASAEVAAGNTDLSHRTEQTASHLQQTASAMEQLTATVRQSADAAAQANQLAASASGTAQRGGEVVSQVVSTMDEINHSSKRIADIIGTIDGIAFQTNILALNAAVEAARAGEQGRGFAVVAAEVRSLAQRSAEAAREIKALIGSSVDKVEAGARLVQAAGSTMTEIVTSVQRVSDIIGEISAAATEQSSGIGQVGGAVSSLDQMTQQNAALVEQSAAAAESLRSQAERLTEVVGRFRT